MGLADELGRILDERDSGGAAFSRAWKLWGKHQQGLLMLATQLRVATKAIEATSGYRTSTGPVGKRKTGPNERPGLAELESGLKHLSSALADLRAGFEKMSQTTFYESRSSRGDKIRQAALSASRAFVQAVGLTGTDSNEAASDIANFIRDYMRKMRLEDVSEDWDEDDDGLGMDDEKPRKKPTKPSDLPKDPAKAEDPPDDDEDDEDDDDESDDDKPDKKKFDDDDDDDDEKTEADLFERLRLMTEGR